MAQASIAECDAANDAANALINGGVVKIKTGTEGDIDSGSTGTLLETFNLPATAFQSSLNRTAIMNAISGIVATSTGNPPYHYEVEDSGGNLMRSGTIGTSGSDMIINQSSWVAGDNLTITAWQTTQPK